MRQTVLCFEPSEMFVVAVLFLMGVYNAHRFLHLCLNLFIYIYINVG